MQKLQLTAATLDNESKEMEERLQQLKEHMSKEKEERGSLRLPLFYSTRPFSAPLQPPPPPSFRSVAQRTARRNRVKEAICGPCEVKTAGLCAECTRICCFGCFVNFHQKGALKLHNTTPAQVGSVTWINILNLVGGVQMVNDEEEKEMRGIETSCLLDGNFSEEESARYFQEALKQWRGERRNGKEQLMDTPTVRVQFTQNKLTYMDRLLLKKHRRCGPLFFRYFYPCIANPKNPNPCTQIIHESTH
uniref:B box-type domain-containing protein n=1 Tax=Oryzias melastigma TaxID=30732 RepID=A0A3B3BE74_ORYME